MNTYTRSMRGKSVPAPSNSKPAIVPGFEAYSFFAWRGNDPVPSAKPDAKPAKVWCICEASTGHSVSYGDTLDEAQQNAAEVLGTFGHEWLEARLSQLPKVGGNDLFGGSIGSDGGLA